ncbi:PaaI family thioesterase [Nocardioides sp. zg-ZUI104]|uniref:PaaI family thioesterase n=1 Tax=Nocardioides faecalis TaxID=2803858 RepID=UPI001BCD0B01|nr:PaaI family thioesterase [Nocardioides faecalis]MBS4752786.1 PaaI family thioesterase [Nocardioides faecalis]
MAWPYVADDTSDPLLAADAEVWQPFTDAVRELVDACVQSDVDADDVRAAQADVEAALARLGKARLSSTLGQSGTVGSRRRAWGNPVIGVRNPIAPPLHVDSDPAGRAWSDFHLGPAYEGPPGLVHGGVVSLIIDQVLGHAVGAGRQPAMTGTLTIRYERGTPLGDLRVEAWVERREGVKIYAGAHVLGPDGPTAVAEAVFVVPRRFRDQLTDDTGAADQGSTQG